MVPWGRDIFPKEGNSAQIPAPDAVVAGVKHATLQRVTRECFSEGISFVNNNKKGLAGGQPVLPGG